MNAVYEDDTVCILHIHNPARANTPACNTNVASTLEQNAPIHVSAIRDDYETVLADDWLSDGGFKP